MKKILKLLIVITCLHAKWLLEFYGKLNFKIEEEVTICGFTAAGILDKVKLSTAKFQSLQPPAEIDQVAILSTFEIFQFLDTPHEDVNDPKAKLILQMVNNRSL